MLGSIAGDIIGSSFEHHPTKNKSFELFSANSQLTDDTVLTVAIMRSILRNENYISNILQFTAAYSNTGFSGRFIQWAIKHQDNSPEPYHSFGNGSAMRVSPVGRAFNSIEQVLEEAKKTAEISHAHPEGIKGAQSVALAVYLAICGSSRDQIKMEIQQRFDYNLDRRLDEIRPSYEFDVTCQGSVPEAIICFLESNSVEDAIRNAISLGGDSDTQACIAGGIAEAYFGSISDEIETEVRKRLPDPFLNIVDEFITKYPLKKAAFRL